MGSFNWQRSFIGNGVTAAVLFLVGYGVYGSQPNVGASVAKLISFYDGSRTRILIASVIFGFAVLCVMWFSVALASVLRDAGKGGWGTAAAAAGAALGVIFFVLTTVRVGLAYSIAGAGSGHVTSALNDLSWVFRVTFWFPVAMLIMAGSFGLWRAGIFSKAAFGAGVTAMVLVLLGTTTLARHGAWAPDGAYAKLVPTIVMLVWIAAVSAFLSRRSPSTVGARDRAAIAAA